VLDAPFDLDCEKYVVAPQQHGVHGEKVGREDALGLGVAKLGPARLGAGRRPLARTTLATLPFDTLTPSFFSAPTIRR